jgi:hypothetical protein
MPGKVANVGTIVACALVEELDTPDGLSAKRMPKPPETQMFKVAWIALALLSGATTISRAQGLPTAAGAMPPERTSVPLGASTRGFAIDQKGLKSGDPVPDVDVSIGKKTANRTGATIPGNANAVPNGGANRKAVEAKPTSASSGNKSFFESRSNTAITDASAIETPEQVAARKGKGSITGQAGNARNVGTPNNAQVVSPQGSAAAAIQLPSPEASSASRSTLKD